ncbi:hypothetical protein GTN27_04195 [Ochrobactrum sp. EEELCW01]|nr:hypothetical protein GTN27_04195 [Ochrobactrum sp. EEELCW01]
MATKFSPGPWSVQQNGYGTLFIRGSLESTSPMGVVYRELIVGGNNSDTLAEHNAYLIASAPDLYSALTALLNRYVGLVRSGDAGFWDPEAEEEVINSRDALAKARGET